MKSFNNIEFQLLTFGIIVWQIYNLVVEEDMIFLVPIIIVLLLYGVFKIEVFADKEIGIKIKYWFSLGRNRTINWEEIERCSEIGENRDVIIFLKSGETISFSPIGIKFPELINYINHKVTFNEKYNVDQIKQSYEKENRKRQSS